MGKITDDLKKKTGNINLLTPKIFPKEEAKKKFKHYFEKLHNAIYSDDATNIAITGSYGSGKTTIIKNYQNVYDKEETEREYLNISLATFKEEETIEKNKPKESKLDIPLKEDSDKLPYETKKTKNLDNTKEKQNLERLIELSILQQILYHVEPSTIPNSNLKRIRSIKPKLLMWITGLSLLWLFTVTVLFKFNHISKMNPKNWDLSKPLDWFLMLLILVFVSGLGYIIHKGIRLLNNTRISKLKFLQSELELGKDVEKSILNEHLDEIIYFFEKTNFDVVIFEDIDRFENTEIFTKLREMNHLLNNSKLIKRDLGKIVFVYAVRDDKFKNEERTKFFDYIIPIIPFVSPTNANEQLWKLIKQEGLKNTFTKNFIDDVITFIDDIDMRLLTNIFNEFLIYKSKVLSNDGNKKRNDNLLAIIIYKNLYPKDFAQLSQRKGNMYKIISKKKSYVKVKVNNIEDKITVLNEEHSDIKSENIEVINELRAIYINAIHKLIPDAFQIVIGNSAHHFSDLLGDDAFEELQSQNKIKYKFYAKQYNSSNQYIIQPKTSRISFEDVEKEVNIKFNYEERVEFIEYKTNTKTTEIKRQIEDLKTKIIKIESWDLAQIFQKLNIIPDTSKFDNSRLIRYLLLDGYINEYYHHNISLFHEENLSKEDFDFERKVKSAENSSFNYKLQKVDNLISNLDIRFFERPTTLNFDLLNYLLDNQQSEENKLNRFLKQLSNENKRTIEFIDAYIEFEELKPNIYDEDGYALEENNIKPFIKLLCKNWGRFWDYIYLDSNYTEEKTRKYIQYIIQYGEIEDLFFFTNGSNINTYIMQQPEFLTFFEKRYHRKVKEVISALKIEFEELGYRTDYTKQLYNFVYENDHYKINLVNISVILETYHIDEKVSGLDGTLPTNFQSNNYEAILDSECTHLISYINKKKNEYIKKAYLKTELDNEEKEGILTKHFLNNKSIVLDFKAKIIDKTKTVFSNLEEVENIELKKKLFELNKVEATWDNVYSYLSDMEDVFIDDTLINFYNEKNNYERLSKQNLDTEDKDLLLFYRDIRFAILRCDELSIEAYSNLILSINRAYNELTFEEISEDKVKALIENSKLNLTESNYNKLRENFANQHILLIEKKQNIFIKDISLYNLDEEDLTLIIESDKFTNSNTLQLLEYITPENIENSKELSSSILDVVLKNKDLTLSLDKINNILSHKLPTESKVSLLVLYGTDNLPKDRLVELITLLPFSYSKIASKKQTTIPKTDTNNEFIKMLQRKGIVSDKVKENRWNEYRIWMKKI